MAAVLALTAAVLYGSAAGPISVVAPLTALYPAVTVLLATLVLGERMCAGLALGALGILLVTA